MDAEHTHIQSVKKGEGPPRHAACFYLHWPKSAFSFVFILDIHIMVSSGLSLRAGGRGFSPATKRVAPGYFYWKIEEK